MATMNMGEGGAQGGLKDGQRTLVISVTVAALGSSQPQAAKLSGACRKRTAIDSAAASTKQTVAEPAVATQFQVTPVRAAETVSVTAAPVAVLGPILLTTIE